MLWVWILTFLLVRSTATTPSAIDRCPKPDVVPYFMWDKYVGTWYEIESTPNALEFGGQCVRFTYKHSVSSVLNVELNMDMPRTGESVSIYGQLEPEATNNQEAKFQLHYLTPSRRVTRGFSSERYWILDTDYDSYSIAWSCETVQVAGVPTPSHKAWILGRDKVLSDDTYAKVETLLLKNYTDIPRYSLKGTIPCSRGGTSSMDTLALLSALAIAWTIS